MKFRPPEVTAPLGVVYADDDLAVVLKPPELLSCPGTSTPDWDSVSRRIPVLFPHATGPLLAHRLDAQTSGLMVVALTVAAHRHLSEQFKRRLVQKAYEAVLSGVMDTALSEGLIDLPLRGDWQQRPRQVVDVVAGKPAQTRWRVLERGVDTRVHFEPITGRTHQLRVHAAAGLGHTIVGDRLYGIASAERMHLHATALTFTHPATGARLSFTSRPDF